jgi:hypothetical protein
VSRTTSDYLPHPLAPSPRAERGNLTILQHVLTSLSSWKGVGGEVNRPWLAWLCLILFAAFALRLWNLGTQSLWHDEAWSVMSAYQPLRPIDPNYPPFFTVLLGVWIQLAGDSVWAMRFWSLLFGVATVAVVALLARRWFGNRVAILAAILNAVSPILWVYSQEIRSYVLVPLLMVVLLALADAVLNERVSRRVWLWLALTEIILLYTHNLSVPVVAWLNVTLIAVLANQRDWRRLRTWLLVQVGLFVLYLPWLITQRPTGTPLNTPPAVNPSLLWDIWQSYFTGIKALVGADDGLIALTAAFGLMALAALVAVLVYCRSRRMWLVLSQAILIPIFELIIVLAAHVDFHPRYFLAGVPAALMVIALGLDTLTRRRFLTPFALSGAVILAIGIMVRMASVVYSSPIYQHDDFRAIAQRYAQLGPDDAIIIPYGWEPALEYYSRKMGFKAKMIGIPLHSSAETIIEGLRAGLKGISRVEVLTWYQLPADVRGTYPCLLGTTKEKQDELTVSGLNTVSYAGPQDNSSSQSSSDLKVDFGPIQLVRVQNIAGPLATCIITGWQLKSHSDDKWRISVRAENPLRWELARTDSELLNDSGLPSTYWNTDQVGTALSLLKLPDGSPSSVFFMSPNPIAYPIFLTIYSDSHPHGLDALKDGKPVTKDVPVGLLYNLASIEATYQPQTSEPDFGGLYLRRKEIADSRLQPGQKMRVTLEWGQSAAWWQSHIHPFATIVVELRGKDWQASSEGILYPQAHLLTWHELTIPAAASGHAVLRVIAPNGQSTTLAEYDIAPINRIFTEPPLANHVSATFKEAGTLVGFDAPKTANRAEPLNVRLVWKASATPTTAYTVFVHLLDANGQVIAQSDAQPAENKRPTTSWLAGEYITDPHSLTWNRQDYGGSATLEVGLYDQNTGERVKLKDGSDHVALPITITVS